MRLENQQPRTTPLLSLQGTDKPEHGSTGDRATFLRERSRDGEPPATGVEVMTEFGGARERISPSGSPHPGTVESSNGVAADRRLSNMIRSNDIRDMELNVSKGLSFWDAAEQAGVPADLAFQQSYTDPDLRRLYMLSRDRPIVDLRHRRYEMRPGVAGAFDAKQDFLRQLYAAGLFDKLAMMAALADPATKQGREVLAFFAKHILPTVLPRESAQVVQIESNTRAKRMELEEGEARLAELRAKNRALEAEHAEAEARLREFERAAEKKP